MLRCHGARVRTSSSRARCNKYDRDLLRISHAHGRACEAHGAHGRSARNLRDPLWPALPSPAHLIVLLQKRGNLLIREVAVRVLWTQFCEELCCLPLVDHCCRA